MGNSLLSLIKKDFKIFTRSKWSAFVIIIAPLLIVLFAGQAFNSSSLSDIKIATHSNSYTQLSEEILSELRSQNFIIEKIETIQGCIDSVKLTEAQICIILPDDLSEKGSNEDVTFYVDYSRINLAYTLIHKIESKISQESSDVGVTLANDLIETLELTKNNLPEHKEDIAALISEIEESSEIASGIEVTNSQIDSSLTYLTSARDSLNDSTAKDKIISAIKELESLKEENKILIEDVKLLKTKNEDALTELKETSGELESTIKSINSVQIMEAENIVSPIKIKIESVKSDSNNRDYMMPTLLSLIALFGGTLIASTFVLKEKKTKAYFRNFTTPTRDFTFVLGTYITCLIILMLQFGFVFAGMKWILKMDAFFSNTQILLILFISSTVFILLGMFIGYIFKSEETIIFGSVITSALLMFFSNVILPIENISGSLKHIAEFNPLVVSDIALKKTILFGFSYMNILTEIIILGAFAFAFFVLSYFARKITKRVL